MSEFYPQAFRHLADQRNSRVVGKARRDVRGQWVLDIAGPFSFWPARKATNLKRQADQVADMVSGLLCLPVRPRVVDGAIYLTISDGSARAAGG